MRPNVRATYRVQLTPTFDLDRAAAIVPYLARLGISHLYASPLAQATPGSTHGYDVTDHQRVRDELGGEAALRRLWEALDAHAMGMVVDIVPNHMGIRDPSNRWWQDVLRARPLEPPTPTISTSTGTRPTRRRPTRSCCPSSTAPSTTPCATGRCGWSAGPRSPSWRSVTTATAGRPRRRLWLLLGLSASRLHRALRRRHRRAPRVPDAHGRLPRRPALAGRPLAGRPPGCSTGDASSTSPTWPRCASRCPRCSTTSTPSCGDGSPMTTSASRVVQGVRVDHVDGMVDPEGYLERLRDLVGPDRLVIVEKILAADEALPPSWPVDGTTGYDVIARIDEAVTAPVGATELRRRATAFTGGEDTWPTLELRCKRLVADRLLVPEVDRLTRALPRRAGRGSARARPADHDHDAREVVDRAGGRARGVPHLRPTGLDRRCPPPTAARSTTPRPGCGPAAPICPPRWWSRPGPCWPASAAPGRRSTPSPPASAR